MRGWISGFLWFSVMSASDRTPVTTTRAVGGAHDRTYSYDGSAPKFPVDGNQFCRLQPSKGAILGVSVESKTMGIDVAEQYFMRAKAPGCVPNGKSNVKGLSGQSSSRCQPGNCYRASKSERRCFSRVPSPAGGRRGFFIVHGESFPRTALPQSALRYLASTRGLREGSWQLQDRSCCAWHGRLYACRRLGPKRRAEPCPRSQSKDA